MAADVSVDFRSLFRVLPASYMLLAPDGTILDNTDQHETVALKPRAAVIGRHIFDAFPPTSDADYDVFANSLERVRRELIADPMPRIRYDIERSPDQGGGFEESYWQATHFPLLAPDGSLQYILQQTENVTAQHLAEQQAHSMSLALSEAQERAAFTLAALPVMVWTAQADGQIDYFNQCAQQFTGHDPAVAGTVAESLQNIHPDDQAAVAAIRQQAQATATEYQAEYRLRRHDGQYRWLLARGVPRLNAAGEITMWVGCAIDNHEQRLMVEELARTNELQAELSDQAYRSAQLVQSQRNTLYSLFMQAPAMICILRGPEHHFEFVNPGYQSLFPHRQLIGRTVAEALPEVVEQGIVDMLDTVYRTGETFYGNQLEIRLERTAQALPRPSYFNFIYQLLREGDTKAGIMVFAFEVTDQVLAPAPASPPNAPTG